MSLVAACMYQQPKLKILPESTPRFAQFLDCWETGSVHLLESDRMKLLHQEIHRIMIDAYLQKWKTTFIDGANCFNPHQLDTETNRQGLDTQAVLRSISLARPFQKLQTVSLIEKAQKMLLKTPPDKNLLIVSGLSDCFYDPRANTGNRQDEKESIQMLLHAVAVLQRIAVHGSTVIITDRLYKKNSLASYAAKIHLQFVQISEQLTVERMLAHPYKSTQTHQIKATPKVSLSPSQLTLDDFF